MRHGFALYRRTRSPRRARCPFASAIFPHAREYADTSREPQSPRGRCTIGVGSGGACSIALAFGLGSTSCTTGPPLVRIVKAFVHSRRVSGPSGVQLAETTASSGDMTDWRESLRVGSQYGTVLYRRTRPPRRARCPFASAISRSLVERAANLACCSARVAHRRKASQCRRFASRDLARPRATSTQPPAARRARAPHRRVSVVSVRTARRNGRRRVHTSLSNRSCTRRREASSYASPHSPNEKRISRLKVPRTRAPHATARRAAV